MGSIAKVRIGRVEVTSPLIRCNEGDWLESVIVENGVESRGLFVKTREEFMGLSGYQENYERIA